MIELPPQTSRFQKAIAVTLVTSMVLSMSGSIGWADAVKAIGPGTGYTAVLDPATQKQGSHVGNAALDAATMNNVAQTSQLENVASGAQSFIQLMSVVSAYNKNVNLVVPNPNTGDAVVMNPRLPNSALTSANAVSIGEINGIESDLKGTGPTLPASGIFQNLNDLQPQSQADIVPATEVDFSYQSGQGQIHAQVLTSEQSLSNMDGLIAHDELANAQVVVEQEANFLNQADAYGKATAAVGVVDQKIADLQSQITAAENAPIMSVSGNAPTNGDIEAHKAKVQELQDQLKKLQDDRNEVLGIQQKYSDRLNELTQRIQNLLKLMTPEDAAAFKASFAAQVGNATWAAIVGKLDQKNAASSIGSIQDALRDSIVAQNKQTVLNAGPTNTLTSNLWAKLALSGAAGVGSGALVAATGIAAANFWNPIGWVTAGVIVGGVVGVTVYHYLNQSDKNGASNQITQMKGQAVADGALNSGVLDSIGPKLKSAIDTAEKSYNDTSEKGYGPDGQIYKQVQAVANNEQTTAKFKEIVSGVTQSLDSIKAGGRPVGDMAAIARQLLNQAGGIDHLTNNQFTHLKNQFASDVGLAAGILQNHVNFHNSIDAQLFQGPQRDALYTASDKKFVAQLTSFLGVTSQNNAGVNDFFNNSLGIDNAYAASLASSAISYEGSIKTFQDFQSQIVQAAANGDVASQYYVDKYIGRYTINADGSLQYYDTKQISYQELAQDWGKVKTATSIAYSQAYNADLAATGYLGATAAAVQTEGDKYLTAEGRAQQWQYAQEHPGRAIAFTGGAIVGVALTAVSSPILLAVGTTAVVGGTLIEGEQGYLSGTGFGAGIGRGLASSLSGFLLTAPFAGTLSKSSALVEGTIGQGAFTGFLGKLIGVGQTAAEVTPVAEDGLAVLRASSDIGTTAEEIHDGAWSWGYLKNLAQTTVQSTVQGISEFLTPPDLGSFGSGLSTAIKALTLPGRVTGEISNLLVRPSLMLYGLDTGLSGTLSPKGIMDAMVAPSRLFWNPVNEWIKSETANWGVAGTVIRTITQANMTLGDMKSFGVGAQISNSAFAGALGLRSEQALEAAQDIRTTGGVSVRSVLVDAATKVTNQLPMLGFYRDQVGNFESFVNGKMSGGEYAEKFGSLVLAVAGMKGGFEFENSVAPLTVASTLNPTQSSLISLNLSGAPEAGAIAASVALSNPQAPDHKLNAAQDLIAESFKVGGISLLGVFLPGLASVTGAFVLPEVQELAPSVAAWRAVQVVSQADQILAVGNRVLQGQENPEFLPTSERFGSAVDAAAAQLTRGSDGSLYLGQRQLSESDLQNPVIAKAINDITRTDPTRAESLNLKPADNSAMVENIDRVQAQMARISKPVDVSESAWNAAVARTSAEEAQNRLDGNDALTRSQLQQRASQLARRYNQMSADDISHDLAQGQREFNDARDMIPAAISRLPSNTERLSTLTNNLESAQERLNSADKNRDPAQVAKAAAEVAQAQNGVASYYKDIQSAQTLPGGDAKVAADAARQIQSANVAIQESLARANVATLQIANDRALEMVREQSSNDINLARQTAAATQLHTQARLDLATAQLMAAQARISGDEASYKAARSKISELADRVSVLQNQSNAFSALHQASAQSAEAQASLTQIEQLQAKLSPIADRIETAQEKGLLPEAADLAAIEHIHTQALAISQGEVAPENTIALRTAEIETAQNQKSGSVINIPDAVSIEADLNQIQSLLTDGVADAARAQASAQLATLEVDRFNAESNSNFFEEFFNSFKFNLAKVMVGAGLLATGPIVANADIISADHSIHAQEVASEKGSSGFTLKDYAELAGLEGRVAKLNDAAVSSYAKAFEGHVQAVYEKYVELGIQSDEAATLARKYVTYAERAGLLSKSDSETTERLLKGVDDARKSADQMGVQLANELRTRLNGMTADEFTQYRAVRNMEGFTVEQVVADSSKRWQEGQNDAFARILSGENMAIQMGVGLGKTIVVQATIKGRLNTFGQLDIDVALKSKDEVTKYLVDDLVGKGFQEVLDKQAATLSGLKGKPVVYAMQEIVDGLRDGKAQSFEKFEKAMNDPMGVRIWTAEAMGHLNTYALDGKADSRVNDILNAAKARGSRLVLADEGDILLSDPIQFILSGESKSLGKEGMPLSDTYDRVSKLIKSGTITKMDWTAADKNQYNSPGEKFNALSQTQKIYMVEDGQVRLSGSAIAELKNRGLWEQGQFERVVQGIESQNEYTIGKDDQGHSVLAPISTTEGRAQADRILQDRLLAVSIVRAKGYSDESALDMVKKSETALSSSGGQFFVGKSQIVLLSGTIEGVQSAAEIFGVPIFKAGSDKNVMVAGNEFGKPGDAKYKSADVKPYADAMTLARKSAEAMIKNSENAPGRRQLFISQDPLVRQEVIRLLKAAGKPVLSFNENATEDKAREAKLSAPFVVGSMYRAGRGVDYKGSIDLIDDWTNKRASDGVQSLGRVDRVTGQEFTRTIVVSEPWLEQAIRNTYSFNQRDALLDAAKARASRDTDGQVDSKELDGNLNGYGVLSEYKTADSIPTDLEKLRLAAWHLEMNASTRGMESNILNFIKDQALESPILKLAQTLQAGSAEQKAFQVTVHKMLNNDFYGPQARFEVTDAMSGSDRMGRSLENLKGQALRTLEDLQGRLSRVSGSDARVLRDVVDQMISNWRTLDLNRPTPENLSRNLVQADSLQAMMDIARQSGAMLAPTTGGREVSAANVLIAQAQENAAAGIAVSNRELSTIQNMAARELQVRQRQNLSSPEKFIAIAHSSSMTLLRQAVLGQVVVSGMTGPGRTSVGNLQSTFSQAYTQTRSQNRSVVASVISGVGQLVAFRTSVNTPQLHRFETSLNAFIQSPSWSSTATSQDKAVAQVTYQNLATLAGSGAVSPEQITNAFAKGSARITASANANEIQAKLADILGISVNASPNKITVGDGYVVKRDKKNGSAILTLVVNQLNASAGLKAAALVKYSQLSGTPLQIQLPRGDADHLKAFDDLATKANDEGASVHIVYSDQTSLISNLLPLGLRLPISWMRSGNDSDRGPIAELSKAVSDIEQKAASDVIENDLVRLRAVAGQMQEAVNLGLIRKDHLPENVQFLIEELANATNSSADARAAIEAYLDQSVKTAHGQMNSELPGLAPVLELNTAQSPVALMYHALSTGPEAQVLRGTLDPKAAAKAGLQIRLKQPTRAEAYSNLPSDLDRYHQDLVDILAASNTPKTSHHATRQSQRIALRTSVEQAYAAAPGMLNEMVSAHLAGSPEGLVVVPGSFDDASIESLRAAFPSAHIITEDMYQQHQAQKETVAAEARQAAVEAMLPTASDISNGPSILDRMQSSVHQIFTGSLSLPSRNNSRELDLTPFSSLSFSQEHPVLVGAGLGVFASFAAQFLPLHGTFPDLTALLTPIASFFHPAHSSLGVTGLSMGIFGGFSRLNRKPSKPLTERSVALAAFLGNA